MSNITTRPPHYIGPDGRLDDCLVSNGCKIYGTARHSILSTDVIIEERAVVEDSVLLPGAHVKSGAHICRAILGENSTVEEGVKLGSVDTTKDTAVVGNDVVIGKGNDPMINRKAIGYITANYSSTYGSVLLKDRPIASVPFLGRYRLIDFPLSNMMNAGIKTVGVVMPGNYRSLIDHVGSGKGLGPGPQEGRPVHGARQRVWHHQGRHAFLLRDIISNKTLFQRSDKPYVVMMGTNIIFNMDLNTIIDAHENSGAQMTVVYCKATRNVDDETKLEINENGRLTGVSAGVVRR